MGRSDCSERVVLKHRTVKQALQGSSTWQRLTTAPRESDLNVSGANFQSPRMKTRALIKSQVSCQKQHWRVRILTNWSFRSSFPAWREGGTKERTEERRRRSRWKKKRSAEKRRKPMEWGGKEEEIEERSGYRGKKCLNQSFKLSSQMAKKSWS